MDLSLSLSIMVGPEMIWAIKTHDPNSIVRERYYTAQQTHPHEIE
jgi:hypothetical protein